MPRKIFLPPLDSWIRLGADWPASSHFLNYFDNELTLYGENHSKAWDRFKKIDPPPPHMSPAWDAWYARFGAYREASKAARTLAAIPKGTIFQIERYHVSRSGENQITVKMVASPNMQLHPEKQGGKLAGPGRLYFRLEEFNTLPEIEEITNADL